MRPSTSLAGSLRHLSTSTTLSLSSKPFRIGIIGSGPAGFYTATRLLNLPNSESISVDLFESLPVPFGLSRFGVASDHPEVKNCEHKFEETAQDPRFKFYGNVEIINSTSNSSTSLPSSDSPAIQIPLSSLRPYYDAIVLSYGASLDRELNIPGEKELNNVFSARKFVNWYNGHPNHSTEMSELINLSKVESVTIIGQGNVAMDLGRLLLKDVNEFKKEGCDLPEYVLAELSRSKVKKVEIVGRRGPLQLACTTKEIREMMNLSNVSFSTDQILLEEAIEQVEKNPSMNMGRMRKRALALLKKGSDCKIGQGEKEWSFEFLLSPTQLLPSSSLSSASPSFNQLNVSSIEYVVNSLSPPLTSGDSVDPGEMKANPTNQLIRRNTDMVLKSVGYKSIGIDGVPFDERRGVVKNIEGRVVDDSGEVVKGLYTSGWLSTGPTGVIATTMFNAFQTADLVAFDLSSSSTSSFEAKPSVLPIEVLTGAVGNVNKRVVAWNDWERIDSEERRRGKQNGKVREKFTKLEEIFEVLD